MRGQCGPEHRQEAPEAPFVCAKCRRSVPNAGWGTLHRNHCPWCLWSLHVDNRPGDRRAFCKGMMEPIGVWVKGNGEWAVIHRCQQCGEVRANRIAGDDSELVLMSLAVRPLARPPFPLDGLQGLETGRSRPNSGEVGMFGKEVLP